MDFRTEPSDGGCMFFSAYCEHADAEVLLGTGNFVALKHGPLGAELHYVCHCGRRGVVYPKLGRRCSSRSETRLR